jgi:hypothetical protein
MPPRKKKAQPKTTAVSLPDAIDTSQISLSPAGMRQAIVRLTQQLNQLRDAVATLIENNDAVEEADD